MRAALLGLAAAAAVSFTPPATAPAHAAGGTVASSNWAGYAVTGARYRRVVGSWTVPRGSCTPGSEAFSAAWIGLGGFTETSRALEQTGTEFDCTRSGRAFYAAWYELVPAPAHTVKLKVRPGDRMTAAVTVVRSRVTLTLRNKTSGKAFRKVATVGSPDVTSAEWIVEAPSGCDIVGRCIQLPLSDFGTIPFTGAAVTTTDGRKGTISDERWNSNAIQLGATGPSALAPSGSAFSVSFNGTAGALKARTRMPALERPLP